MRKKCFKVLAVSLLLSMTGVINAGCSCNVGKVKVTFVTENNSDIIRYVKKGKTLTEIPETPTVKGKYCVWDTENFQNIQENMTVKALCYSTVTNLAVNMPSTIDVEVSSEEAKLENIFKDLEVSATFESGETRKLYAGEYKIDAPTYDENIGGSYKTYIAYNNAKREVVINVNKLKNYVSVSLSSSSGYLNEGLPSLIVNSDIAGTIKYDENQQLVVGSKAYSWTFTPADLNKYDIVKGSITVDLINASMITTNKESLSVDFGVTKYEIIQLLQRDLIVKGKYGEYFKEIDSRYYSITSSDFVEDKSGTYNFRVSFDANTYVDIPVTVNKCESYLLSVDEITEFIVDKTTDLNDALSLISKSSDIEGVIEFVEGQTLIPGNYEYEYKFQPISSHYAPKYGKIRIHAYQAESMEFTTNNEVVYGTDKSAIIQQLNNNLTGKVYYNDGLIKDIDKSKIVIEISQSYDKLQAGTYDYTIAYNGEIEYKETFVLNKRQLLPGIDFNENPICLNFVDPNNYQVMPTCKIQKLATTSLDFDENKFVLIPLSATVISPGQVYEYRVKLVPDESISNNYTTTEFTFRTFIPAGL